MKRRLVLKESIVKVLFMIDCLAFMLIATTIESNWTKEYFIFFLVNVGIMVITTLILYKYSNVFDTKNIDK